VSEHHDAQQETVPAEDERTGPHAPERVRGYRAVIAAFLGVSATGTLLVGRIRPVPHLAPPTTRVEEWSDVVLVGLATHRLARLVTKDRVSTPLRAPFTLYEGPAGPGEVNEKPVGTGWRRSVGELLSCPFCIAVWIATASFLGLQLAPRLTRSVLRAAGAVAIADALQFVYVDLEHRAES
jgi:hypothetical protein